MEYQKQDIVQLTIEKALFEGKYLARLPEGEVVLLEGIAVPGETVEALLLKHRKNYWEGQVLKQVQDDTLSKADARVKATCPYFGRCGGCQYQHMNYEKQLEIKQGILAENLRQMGKMTDFELEPVIASPEIWRYRNKSELNFVDDDFNGAVLGQCEKGSWLKIVDMEDCHIFPEEFQKITKVFRDWRDHFSLSSFHRKKFVGFLRHLIMRRAYHTGEWMLIVVSSDDYPDFFKKDNIDESIKELFSYFIEKLKDEFNLKSVVWRLIKLRRGKGESYLDKNIWGDDFITEKLLDLEYRISPDAFFQNNTPQAENLIKTALDYLELEVNDKPILDLYCGVGTFTLALAKNFPDRKIYGLELVASAVEAAAANSNLNNLENIEFMVGDATKMVDDLRDKDFGAIVVDPPRAGLTVKVIEFLLEMAPPSIVYVSCSPVTLSRDLGLLKEKYDIEKIQGVDLFPQTYHLETVVKLKKKA